MHPNPRRQNQIKSNHLASLTPPTDLRDSDFIEDYVREGVGLPPASEIRTAYARYEVAHRHPASKERESWDAKTLQHRNALLILAGR